MAAPHPPSPSNHDELQQILQTIVQLLDLLDERIEALEAQGGARRSPLRSSPSDGPLADLEDWLKARARRLDAE